MDCIILLWDITAVEYHIFSENRIHVCCIWKGKISKIFKGPTIAQLVLAICHHYTFYSLFSVALLEELCKFSCIGLNIVNVV